MRRPSTRSPLLPLALALAVVGPAACDRTQEPAAGSPPPSAAIAHGDPRPIGALPALSASAQHMLPVAQRDPDWGLDPSDPAKDYVTRYVRAARRYGDQTSCVVVGRSSFADGRSVVEVRNDDSQSCGKVGDLRDRYFVNIGTDKMSLDPSLHQPPLQRWPDGSDPEGPAGKVSDAQDLRAWKAKLGSTLRDLKLVPLRVQLYGRGTFPVVTLAGWHGPILRDMGPGELEAPAKALCEANDGQPLGLFTALDRSTFLHIGCSTPPRWEAL